MMYWGGAWIEHDVSFDTPGRYRLGVKAQGRFTGHPDEKKVPLVLAVHLAGQPIGNLTFPADGKTTTRYLDFQAPAAGRHPLRVEFPVDAGDIFVDCLTLERKAH